MDFARRWPVLVLLLLLPIWCIGFFGRGIWMPDEPREYDITRNMVGDGDFVLPRLAGEPFLEKPPLAYWLQSVSLRALGASAAAARVPNLLWALLATLCIGLLAADLAPRERKLQASVLATVGFATTLLTLQVQMWLATDAPLVAMTAAALLCAWRLMHAQSAKRQFGWAIALGSSLAGAFLAKNGFGLLVPGLALLGWLAWERRLRYLLRWPILLAAGWFALCAGAWVFALALRPNGNEFVHVLLWDNLVTRFLPVAASPGRDFGHASSHWDYLLRLPVYVLPWTFAWWAAARWSLSELRTGPSPLTSAIRYCIAATIPACIVLLLSRTARDVYFAPSLLGGSILVSLWLAVRADALDRVELALHRLTSGTLLVFAALFAAAALVLLMFIKVPASTFMLLLPFAIPVVAGILLARRLLESRPSALVSGAGTFILALGLLELVIFPTIDRAEDLGALVTEAAGRLRAGRVATYCGDETIRAVLDHSAGLRLQDACTPADAARLLDEHGDQEFLVELEPPSAAQRVRELAPAVDTSRWNAEPRRPNRRITELTQLGLHPLAQWVVPGGRRYALFGRQVPDHSSRASMPIGSP